MEQLFYQPDLLNGTQYLNEEESRHCIKVLRKKTGEHISLTDGQGSFYEAVILDANPKKCLFRVESVTKETPRHFTIHLAVSPTKNADRMEWMLEKCVELGLDEFTPLHCHNTERKVLKTDRLEKIAISAMKQSRRARIPAIHPLTDLANFISQSVRPDEKFIAYVDPANPIHLLHAAKPKGTYLMLIGPEGDFTPHELELALEQGYKKVSLGHSRLRTETAGLAACHILNLINY